MKFFVKARSHTFVIPIMVAGKLIWRPLLIYGWLYTHNGHLTNLLWNDTSFLSELFVVGTRVIYMCIPLYVQICPDPKILVALSIIYFFVLFFIFYVLEVDHVVIMVGEADKLCFILVYMIVIKYFARLKLCYKMNCRLQKQQFFWTVYCEKINKSSIGPKYVPWGTPHCTYHCLSIMYVHFFKY